MNIVIVGGGIGGLAAALACSQAGHDVTVLERRSEFTELGAGIQLGPNAFHALDRLGVSASVKERAVHIEELRLMDGLSGEVIAKLLINDTYKAAFNNPYLVVHRTDLYYPLLAACQIAPTIKLHVSSTVTQYSQTAEAVKIDLDTGASLIADAVIGADGIRSTIRQQLVGDGAPKICGHTIYRSVVPMHNIPLDLSCNRVTLWAGPKWHFVHYPIAGGKFMNMAATRDDGAINIATGEDTSKETVLAQFPGLSGDAKRLSELGENWKRWVLCDRDPIKNWTDNRIALLGDAAHPMLQYAAQGACMALEDAVLLGTLLEGATSANVSQILRNYNTLRCDRTSRIVQIARDMGNQIYHVAGQAAKERNDYLQSLSQAELQQKLSWLHGMPAPFINTTTQSSQPMHKQTA